MKKLADLRGMSHEEWLMLRKKGIGGSDAGAVCGLNPYRTAMQVYQDKTTDTVEKSDNEAMRQGRELEEYVARRFTEETGKKVRRSNFMYVHEQHSFMLADIDRWIIGENAGLECKTASPYMTGHWKEDAIPPHYVLQCHHYMAVCNADAWYLAVLIYGKEFRYYRIERDEQVLSDLIRLEEDFWKGHVEQRCLPEPDGSRLSDEVLAEYFKEAGREHIRLTGFDEELKRRQQLQGLIDKMETEKKTIDQKIKKFLGERDAETAENADYRISWKLVNSNRLDEKMLKEEQPEIYEKYLRNTQSRRFLVKTA